MTDFLVILLIAVAGSAISLTGGILMLSRESSARLLARYSVPFSVGAILAVVLFDLLPEGIENLPPNTLKWTVVAGMVASFGFEKLSHRFHHHDKGSARDDRAIPVALIIAGDLMHNVLDGVAIGVAFLIGMPAGLVTAIAVAAHEIPREIGDFGLLLSAGFSRRNVILTNVSIACVSVITILATVRLGTDSRLPTDYMLALAAGVFTYIAVAELMPLVGRDFKNDPGRVSVMWLLAGLLAVSLAASAAGALLH